MTGLMLVIQKVLLFLLRSVIYSAIPFKSEFLQVLEGKPQYLDITGNIALAKKPSEQPSVHFHSFRVNRLPFAVQLADSSLSPIGRAVFRQQPYDFKSAPLCGLDIILPELNGSEDVVMNGIDEELAKKIEALSEKKPGNIDMIDFTFHLSLTNIHTVNS